MNYFNLLESKLETSDKIINKYITINFHWNQSHRINIGKDTNTSMYITKCQGKQILNKTMLKA